jgi:hypothetical protein
MQRLIQRVRRNPDALAVGLLCATLGAGGPVVAGGLLRPAGPVHIEFRLERAPIHEAAEKFRAIVHRSPLLRFRKCPPRMNY